MMSLEAPNIQDPNTNSSTISNQSNGNYQSIVDAYFY